MIDFDPNVLFGLIIGLIGIAGGVIIYAFHAKQWREALKESEAKYNKALSHRKSSEVRLGHIGENLAPFLKDWPYSPGNFRFLGHPIDGIQINDDAIILIEIKTGNARLSKTQKRARQLVREGKVYFETFRISEDGCHLHRDVDKEVEDFILIEEKY